MMSLCVCTHVIYRFFRQFGNTDQFTRHILQVAFIFRQPRQAHIRISLEIHLITGMRSAAR